MIHRLSIYQKLALNRLTDFGISAKTLTMGQKSNGDYWATVRLTIHTPDPQALEDLRTLFGDVE